MPELGRTAIDAALDALYPTQRDLRFASPARADGRPPSIAELAVYRCPESRAHWHYVTYGLSEVFGKQTKDPATSGFGFELTMRLAADGDAPPPWPMRVHVHLADYVFETGNRLQPLHDMRLTGLPARLPGPATETMVFAEDARLAPVQSANGRVAFVQAFGVTRDEEELVARWDAAKFLEVVRRANPLLVTDVARPSMLRDPALAAELEAAARRDGSSREVELVPGLRVDHERGMGRPVKLHLDAIGAEVLARLLRTRVAHGRRARIETGAVTLQLVPAMSGYEPWTADDGTAVHVGIPPERIEELAAGLASGAGTVRWPWFPELTVEWQLQRQQRQRE
jgi:hypothetical protein